MEEIRNAETCLAQDWGNLGYNFTNKGSHCPSVWDGLLCWEPAPSGAIASSKCPPFKGSDITKSAFRVCSFTGDWLDRHGNPSTNGWTNYTSCLTPEIREIMKRLGSNDDAQVKYDIALNTRILEFVGLSLSLAALLLSLIIFCYFRTLRNSRTRLHTHLFIAMVIQVGIRLVVYTDQALTRSFDTAANGNVNISTHAVSSGSTAQSALIQQRRGIDNTPILCEASYICLEYARTAMFMWMFVEGLFLHNMITVTVFEEKLSPLIYPFIGWIVPIPLTVVWAIVTHWHYGTATCWWGYNLTLYFWILEGPRLAVLLVNLAFLLNILKVLITKLRQSTSSETQQAMKAVKAALFLLPLLGLTNLLNMLDAPLEKSALQFALWSYSTHLLTSTQGFILAFLYCFKNAEVQKALRKFIRNRLCGHRNRTSQRQQINLAIEENESIYRKNFHQSGNLSQTYRSNPMVVLTIDGNNSARPYNSLSPLPNSNRKHQNGFLNKCPSSVGSLSGSHRSLEVGSNASSVGRTPPLVIQSYDNKNHGKTCSEHLHTFKLEDNGRKKYMHTDKPKCSKECSIDRPATTFQLSCSLQQLPEYTSSIA